MKRFRRILHPSDFSAASRPAFALALDLARRDRARLIVLHVITPPILPVAEGPLSPTVWLQLERQIRTHAERETGKLITRARQAGVLATSLLLEGPAADRIVRAARRLKTELIVMGTRGRSGLARILLGSVAERVIASAHAPVLTVRARSS